MHITIYFIVQEINTEKSTRIDIHEVTNDFNKGGLDEVVVMAARQGCRGNE